MAGDHNLARLADAAVDRHGDRPSLWFEGQWYRSGDLQDRVHRVAAGLRELDVAAGDRVVVHMANCPEVGITYQATWRAGAVTTPAIFLLPVEELRHVLASSEAAAVVTTPEFVDKVVEAADALDHVRHVICVGEPPASLSGRGVVPFAQLEQAAPSPIVDRADDDLAALLFTGGTTGRAKGVALSHENLWFCARAAEEAGRLEGVTRTIMPLPLAHAYGLTVSVAAGHTVEPSDSILLRWFDPTSFLQLVDDHGAQRATVVPTMLQVLLGMPLEDHDLSSLRIVNCGSAPLPTHLAEAFEQRVPSAEVLEGYGLSESAGIATANRAGARRLGTVGQPLPGYTLRIVDETGQQVPTGEVGEVMISSRGVMQGYWRDPDATDAALRDGWLATGDLGSVDGDGYLTIADRKKDLIIRGGFNVHPSDVEAALAEHPDVVAAGVVGRPDERYGEEVVAFAQLTPGAAVAGDELVAWSRDRLGGYRYPREVHVVDELPRTPVLKIDRKALRGQLTDA